MAANRMQPSNEKTVENIFVKLDQLADEVVRLHDGAKMLVHNTTQYMMTREEQL